MSDDKKRDDMVIDMGDRKGAFDAPPRSPAPPQTPGGAAPLGAVTNNPIFPVLSYCGSSILMTVTNKFVLSGTGFNLNFFLLCVQVSQGAMLLPLGNHLLNSGNSQSYVSSPFRPARV